MFALQGAKGLSVRFVNKVLQQRNDVFLNNNAIKFIYSQKIYFFLI